MQSYKLQIREEIEDNGYEESKIEFALNTFFGKDSHVWPASLLHAVYVTH